MRGASIALGACSGLALAFLVAKGPGGVDAKLYWNAPLPTIRALAPESVEPSAVETDGDLVAAERGEADYASEVADDVLGEEGTLDVEGADSVSPPATPEIPTETGAADAPTFPTLSPEQRERFRRAWFESVTEFDLTPPASAEYEGAQSGSAQQGASGAQAGVTEAPVIEQEIVEEQIVEEVPVSETTVVVPAAPAESHDGTNQELDPFYLDAQRMQRAREQGETSSPGFYTTSTWTGAATTGGATTGGATTGAATSGGATTGGATTGAATSGGATTGGATTGAATAGGAWTGGAWTGASNPTMSGY